MAEGRLYYQGSLSLRAGEMVKIGGLSTDLLEAIPPELRDRELNLMDQGATALEIDQLRLKTIATLRERIGDEVELSRAIQNPDTLEDSELKAIALKIQSLGRLVQSVLN